MDRRYQEGSQPHATNFGEIEDCYQIQCYESENSRNYNIISRQKFQKFDLKSENYKHFEFYRMDTDFDAFLFQTNFRRKRQKMSEIRKNVELKLFGKQIVSENL